jgi:uncharacterized protein (TIGR02246 family)
MPDTLAEHLRTLEQRRCAALARNDAQALSNLFHPQLLYTHGTGRRDNAQSFLERVDNGYFKFSAIDCVIDHVTIAGDTACLVGTMQADLTVEGSPKKLHNRFLSVWHCAQGAWRFLAYQPAPAGS